MCIFVCILWLFSKPLKQYNDFHKHFNTQTLHIFCICGGFKLLKKLNTKSISTLHIYFNACMFHDCTLHTYIHTYAHNTEQKYTQHTHARYNYIIYITCRHVYIIIHDLVFDLGFDYLVNTACKKDSII